MVESATLEKGLCLLDALARAKGAKPFGQIVKQLGLPLSTAHRLLDTLEHHGHLVRIGRGRYIVGVGLVDLASGSDRKNILITVSRPFLRACARAARRTVHLGVLEGDMVTYLVKEHGGRGPQLLTREGIQFEAYCSGIGKVLLSALESKARNAYLDNGPFVALTEQTITAPEKLRREFSLIRSRGYAVDNGEVIDDLRCIAVPLRDRQGHVVAAISMAGRVSETCAVSFKDQAAMLAQCAENISQRIWPVRKRAIKAAKA